MEPTETRLNKYLASCGLGSRRACDKMILDGLVIVNGHVQINPAIRVTENDFVKIGNKRVQALQTETILLNKPKGLVCSKNDELDRDTIYALIPNKYQHLNHVGRLDKESEGLIILTNDGDLAQSLTHPSKKIEKEYIVTTDQAFDNAVLTQFLKGIHTPEGRAQAKSVKRLSPRRVKIVLETGLKRQIRMMFQAVHVRVKKLVRVRIGCLEGGNLEQGRIEPLDQERIDLLFATPAFDPRATTLKSQAEFHSAGKKQAPKKWARPSSRSHDGIKASDRPQRRKPAYDEPGRSDDTPRPFTGKKSSSSRGSNSRGSDQRGSSSRGSNSRSPGKRSFSKPSGRSVPKRNTQRRPER